MKFDITRAWKDETYRESLSNEQLDTLPSNPAGELSDSELEAVFGGWGGGGHGGIVYNKSVRTAGNHMDEAIMQFMRRRHGLLIGDRTAEQVKIEIGSAWPVREPLTMEVRGRCLREGRPRVVTVPDSDIREALAESLKVIVAAVKEALDVVPPEIAADIIDRGVVLTGGGALLRGLDELLRRETGVPIMVADDPLTSVVRGAGLMLEDLALLKRVAAAA